MVKEKIKNNFMTKIRRKLSFSDGIERIVLLIFSLSLISLGVFFVLGGCSVSRKLGSMKVNFCGDTNDLTSWAVFFFGSYLLYLWWKMEAS